MLFQQFRVFFFPFSNFQSPDELFRYILLTVFMICAIWEERPKQGRKVREEFRIYRALHCWFCPENRFIWVSPSLKSMHQMLSYLHYFTNKRQPVSLVYCIVCSLKPLCKKHWPASSDSIFISFTIVYLSKFRHSDSAKKVR